MSPVTQDAPRAAHGPRTFRRVAGTTALRELCRDTDRQLIAAGVDYVAHRDAAELLVALASDAPDVVLTPAIRAASAMHPVRPSVARNTRVRAAVHPSARTRSPGMKRFSRPCPPDWSRGLSPRSALLPSRLREGLGEGPFRSSTAARNRSRTSRFPPRTPHHCVSQIFPCPPCISPPPA